MPLYVEKNKMMPSTNTNKLEYHYIAYQHEIIQIKNACMKMSIMKKKNTPGLFSISSHPEGANFIISSVVGSLYNNYHITYAHYKCSKS